MAEINKHIEGLKPNEGITQVMNGWKGIKIKSSDQILKIMNNPSEQKNKSQKDLLTAPGFED